MPLDRSVVVVERLVDREVVFTNPYVPETETTEVFQLELSTTGPPTPDSKVEINNEAAELCWVTASDRVGSNERSDANRVHSPDRVTVHNPFEAVLLNAEPRVIIATDGLLPPLLG